MKWKKVIRYSDWISLSSADQLRYKKSVSHGKKRRWRFRVWTADPKCHWCGVETNWMPETKRDPKRATIDHLYPRGSAQRTVFCGLSQCVLACYACNNRRGKEWGITLREEGRLIHFDGRNNENKKENQINQQETNT